MKDKAYKVVSNQLNISNKKAKQLIDDGLVLINNKRLNIARKEIDIDSKIKLINININKIFEDNNILAIDKPPFITSENIAKKFKNYYLLNRLDKETSGIILFAKNKNFQERAINEYKNHRVYKEYIAIVEGKFAQEVVIDKPIITTKDNIAKSKVSKKGKSATTYVYPLFIEGNKSKVKVVIKEGRTHQIRVHLSYIGYPIIGDSLYGKMTKKSNRIMLHNKITKIFDYEFISNEPKEFKAFGL